MAAAEQSLLSGRSVVLVVAISFEAPRASPIPVEIVARFRNPI
jgi:hypothetical protein